MGRACREVGEHAWTDVVAAACLEVFATDLPVGRHGNPPLRALRTYTTGCRRAGGTASPPPQQLIVDGRVAPPEWCGWSMRTIDVVRGVTMGSPEGCLADA